MRVLARQRDTFVGLLAALLLAAPAGADAGADGADGLAAQAERYQRALAQRHWSPEGLILYRVDLRSIAEDLRSGSYPDLADTPTFNGILAAGACAGGRLEPARRALDGLEFLMRVTGVPGLLARAVRRGSPSADRPERWLRGGPGFEEYWWRSDASFDQYANGLVPAVAACRHSFPERARRLVTGAAEHLLANDMKLVDPDGEPTRFGDLSPRSGFGFNSLAQLTSYAIFSLAASLDADPRWLQTRNRLRDVDRVVARSRVTNLRVLHVTNTSNDLMAFQLLHALLPLARETGDPAAVDLRQALHRAWLRVRGDGQAYHALLLCDAEPTMCSDEILAAVRAQLESFPDDRRQLAPAPELANLPRRWLPGRKFKTLAREPIPMAIRPASSLEWKSSAYRLQRAGAPDTEYTGVDFLVAYWRYLEVLEARARLE